MKELDKLKFQKEAVVTYILDNKKILLIEKKRGLGAGKINVPGGHIEALETPYQAAVRETKEEVNLDVNGLKLKGYLFFEFKDGLTMKGYVYTTTTYSGEPKESDEANPFWEDIDKIPYNKMWEDDLVWLPEMLKNRYFRGYFLFDDDTMLQRRVQFYDSFDEFI